MYYILIKAENGGPEYLGPFRTIVEAARRCPHAFDIRTQDNYIVTKEL